LRLLFDCAALYCLYEIRDSGENYNVYTTLLRAVEGRTTSITRHAEKIDLPSRHGTRRFGAYRRLIGAHEAEKFIAEAEIQHRAALPGSEVVVRYAPLEIDHAFLSDRSEGRLRSPLHGRAAWSARRWTRTKRVGNVTVQEGSLAKALGQLPTIDDVRYRLLDVYDRPDAIGDLEDLYPIGLSIHPRSELDAFEIEIKGEERWFSQFPQLSVHGVLGKSQRPLTSVYHRFILGERRIRWTGIDVGELDVALSCDGILLARQHTFPVRALQGTVHMSNRIVRIELAEEQTTIDVAIQRDDT